MLGLGLSLIKGAGKNVGAFLSYIKDSLKLYYRFYDTQPDFLLDGSTSFDGTDDYISIADADNLSFGDSSSDSAFSISAWIKMDDATTFPILAKGVFNTNGEYYLTTLSDDKLYFFLLDESGSSTREYIHTSSTLTTYENQWVHITVTYDGRGGTEANAGQKVYINGSVASTLTGGGGSYVAMENLTSDVYIGRYDSTYADGSIANVGIWNRELSASEVESIYWRGSHSELQNTELTNLVSWYDLQSTTTSDELITNGGFDTDSDWSKGAGWSIADGKATKTAGSANSLVQAINGTVGATYEITFTISDYSAGSLQPFIGGSGASTARSANGTYTQSRTLAGATSIYLYASSTFAGSVDNVSVKELNVHTDSQSSNDGANIGATTNSDSYSGESPFKPRIQDKAHPKMAVQLADGSTSFGNDDKIDLGTDTFNIGKDGYSYSIGAWFKAPDQDDNSGIFSSQTSSSNEFQILLLATGRVQTHVYDGSTQGTVTTGTDDEYNDNQWHHVVSVLDSSADTLSLYVDGSLIGSTTWDEYTTGSLVAQIGARFASSNYFNGSIANVSIHSSALTQTQIQELMFTEKYSGLSADLKTNLVSWYDLGSIELGTSLITGDSSDMDTIGNWATGSWSSGVGVSLTSVSGGQDGNAMQLDSTSGRGYARYNSNSGLAVTNGRSYRFSIWGKNGEGEGAVALGNAKAGSNYQSYYNFTNSDGIVFTSDFQTNDTDLHISLIQQTGGSSVLFDNVTVKPINVADSHGSNTGEVYGATTNTGYTHSPHGVVDPLNFGEMYSGRALNFDGSNDYVNISDDNSLDFGTNDFSISAWINIDAIGSTREFLSKRSGVSNSVGYMLRIHSSGNLAMEIDDGAGNEIYLQGTSPCTAGVWHHVVYTFDRSGNCTIYRDGNSITSGSISSVGSISNSVDLEIGSLATFFDGKMNNVKMFENVVLTESQIRELYTKPETVLPTGVSASNLKLDLPMQEKAGSIVYDGSGNQNHGTISGATWVSGQEYGYQASLVRSNTPIFFDGSNDYVSCGNIGITSYPFTYSAWFRTNGTTKNTICALADADQNVVFYQFLITDTGLARINARNTADDFCDSSGTYNDGEWHHGVAVFASATDRKIYIDGVADGSDTSSVAFSSGVDEFSIGVLNRSSKADYYDDDINEVAVWDVALDADAISALYNSGVPLLPTSDSGNYDNSSNLVGYWRNDGKPTWTDRSTNSNNGTVNGSPVSILIPEGNTEGRDNQGYYLSDTNTISNGIRLRGSEYIKIEPSEIFEFAEEDFTVECWVKLATDALNQRIMEYRSASGAYWWFYTNLATGVLRPRIDDGTNNVVWNTTTNICDDTWHHLCVVFDRSSDAFTYIDGVEEASPSITSIGDMSSGSPIYIGTTKDTNLHLNGLVDEVRIYNKALSVDEVTKNYNNGKSSHQ